MDSEDSSKPFPSIILLVMKLSSAAYLWAFAAPAFVIPDALSQGKPLYACASFLYHHETTYRLPSALTCSQYLECKYTWENGQGRSTVNYCWYDYRNYTLYHDPNTPLPIDSHVACPAKLDIATVYRIRSSLDYNKCITAMGEYDGAPVEIQDCRADSWRPSQIFHFTGDCQMQHFASDKCIDVKDGVQQNGVRLQSWTCAQGNRNQQFVHWQDPNFLVIPEDHINWMPFNWLCVDLTDGKLENGTPVQMWACNYQNPNQPVVWI
ncbi:hypothetical protein CC2G_009847 [Coprinopsis cinerea AmutBmut pab1-1]|nr:hypothetical protein CC2G_009847 [Coprinopsis cinerea AmutBmut pab1-1]